MYCVGLTGNIASGKSTAAAFFNELDIEIISADSISRELTAPHTIVLKQIVDYFGPNVLNADSSLNRQVLRTMIFQDPNKRHWLETLTHPLIRQELKNRAEHVSSPYSILEIPLLTARQDYPFLNRILVIFSTSTLQVQRVIERDNSDEASALSILKTQPSDTERQLIADDVIYNNSSIDKLKQNVIELHNKYLHLALESS